MDRLMKARELAIMLNDMTRAGPDHDNLEDQQMTLLQLADDSIEIAAELMPVIMQIPDTRQRSVLTGYYLNGEQIKDIAYRMSIPREEVCSIKDAAMKSYEQVTAAQG